MAKIIGVKYCGGCNPTINRVGIVGEIQKALPPGYALISDTSVSPWETGIMMCGCISACIDKPEIRNLARRWIVVAGNNVDMLGVPEKEIARTIVERIMSFS